MDFWETWTFADLLAEPVRNGIYKKKKFHGKGQKVINMGELFSYDFISNQEMRRIELNDRELANYLVKDGDLLFARRSFVLEGSGKCSLVVQPSENTTFESSIIRARPNPDWTDPHFYYYLFRSPQGRALISSIATRTAVSGIRGSELALLKVPKPPLPTQRKIATVLSAYDDLIENNTRRIKILEEMASAIYREWFVEFRFPGHEGVEMVESELGLIPQGWEVNLIDELIDFKSGYAFKSNTFVDQGNYNIVTIKNVKDGEFQPVCDNRISDLLSNLPDHCHLKNGDILLSLTGNIGRTCLVYGKDYLLNQRVAKLVPKNPNLYPFVYVMFRQRDLQLRLEAIATGVAQQNLSPIKAGKLTCLTPSPRVLTQFSNFVKPYMTQILNLNQKNINLRQTRDLLLPKLISGEIDVSELDIDTD